MSSLTLPAAEPRHTAVPTAGSRPPSRWQVLALVAAIVTLAATATAAGVAALMAGGNLQIIGPPPGHAQTVAVFVSGDAGLKFGMGKPVTRALSARGLPVFGVSSPAVFRTRKTHDEVVAIVADAIRAALATTEAKRIVLMGQSYGADMVSVAAPDLPADLKSRIAAIVLVVPGKTAFFRADALGFAYRGKPDAEPAAGMRTVDWTPVICVYGVKEDDSQCPLLAGSPARLIPLPGGHYLDHDEDRLIGALVEQLHAIDPTLLP